MKRPAILAVMCLYLLSAIGVTATSFYCCGFLRSTSFSIGENSPVQSKTQSFTGNCCKTTKNEFKVKDDHLISATFFAKVKISPSILSSAFLCNVTLVQAENYPAANDHAPPPWQHKSIYDLTCNYRI